MLLPGKVVAREGETDPKQPNVIFLKKIKRVKVKCKKKCLQINLPPQTYHEECPDLKIAKLDPIEICTAEEKNNFDKDEQNDDDYSLVCVKTEEFEDVPFQDEKIINSYETFDRETTKEILVKKEANLPHQVKTEKVLMKTELISSFDIIKDPFYDRQDIANSQETRKLYDCEKSEFFENYLFNDETDEKLIIKSLLNDCTQITQKNYYKCDKKNEVSSETPLSNCENINQSTKIDEVNNSPEEKATNLDEINHTETKWNHSVVICRKCLKSYSSHLKLPKTFYECLDCRQNDLIHTGKKLYKYSDCSVKFSDMDKLNSHICNNTKEKPLKCDRCKQIFKNETHSKIHKCIQKGFNRYQNCKMCHYSNSCKGHAKPYHCRECKKSYNQEKLLAAHVRGGYCKRTSVLKCKECDKEYIQGQLKEHLIADHPYKCLLCVRRFSSESKLTIHNAVHIVKKPYSCKECDSKFKLKSKLNSHILTHKSKKLFNCNECDLSFSLKNDLTKHSCIHTGEIPELHKCTECDKIYFKKRSLKLHTSKCHVQKKDLTNIP